MVKEGGPLKTLTCGLNETGSHSKVWSGNDLSRPTGMGTGPSEPQGGTSVCSLQPLVLYNSGCGCLSCLLPASHWGMQGQGQGVQGAHCSRDHPRTGKLVSRLARLNQPCGHSGLFHGWGLLSVKWGCSSRCFHGLFLLKPRRHCHDRGQMPLPSSLLGHLGFQAILLPSRILII